MVKVWFTPKYKGREDGRRAARAKRRKELKREVRKENTGITSLQPSHVRDNYFKCEIVLSLTKFPRAILSPRKNIKSTYFINFP